MNGRALTSLIQLMLSAAVVGLVADVGRLAPFVVDENGRAGHVERGVGEDVVPRPLDHDPVGGEEEDGVLARTPCPVIHRRVDDLRAVVGAAGVDHHVAGGQLAGRTRNLALDGVVRHQLTLSAEEVDVADLVRIGVADQAFADVAPLEPAASLHLLLRVWDGFDGHLAVLLGDLLGLALRRVFGGTVVAGGGDEHEPDRQCDDVLVLEDVHG